MTPRPSGPPLADFSVWALLAACIANVFAAFRSNENKKLMDSDGLAVRTALIRPPSCVDSQHRTRQPAHHAPLPGHHPTHTARRTRKLRPTPLRPTPLPGPYRLGGQPVRSDDPPRRPLRPAGLPAHRGLQAGRVHGALTLTPTMTLTLTTDPVH